MSVGRLQFFSEVKNMEKRAREKAIADGIVENHDLSSSRCCDCDWDWDWDCDCDCEVETPSILLDDNSFPLHNNVIDSSSRDTIRSIDTEVLEEEEDSFASDFYHCGTDWSSLLLPEKENDKKPKLTKMNNNNNLHDPNAMLQRCLKQTNLFQMWGFPNKTSLILDPNTPDDKDHHHLQDHDINNASSSSSSLPHHHRPNNKKIKSMFSSMKSNSNSNNNAFLLRRGMEGKSKTSNITNNSGVANIRRSRVCPFYKKIPGTPVTVDAFCYGRIEGCNAYILSHFHADHYGGLSKGWSHGPIYCTPITARLVKMCLSVNPLFIHPLELGTEYVIEGIKVTMLEANHCPGAALIYFCLPNGQCYLHTGDFRASKLMHAYPLLVNQRVNVLYLDTTYCNPKYRFPSKEDVMSFVVRVTQNCLRKQPKTLVIVGAYSIGKECVYLAISKALGVKIHTNATRRRILQSFGWPELSGNLCSQGKETPLHVLPMSSLRFEVLERYLKTYMNQYTAVLAFRPTGWTYSETIGSHLDLIKPTSRGIVTIYGVPYSEHSSFTELREFVQFLRPGKIIPTVNVGNAANRDKMQSYFQEWLKG